jgi:hypothetical protein
MYICLQLLYPFNGFFLYLFEETFFYSSDLFCLEVCFVRYQCIYFCLLCFKTYVPFVWNIFFYFTFKPVCLCCWDIFLVCNKLWVFFFNPIDPFVSFGWRIQVIKNHNYYLQVCNNSCHFVVFIVFESFFILFCLLV